MKLERYNPAAVELRVQCKNSDRLQVMLMSDVHFDSVLCDLDLFEKHLKVAEEAHDKTNGKEKELP